MLSTIHQRSILSEFQKHKTLNLDDLKKHFVETKIMNQTTLYRILERWKNEKILHEINIDKKRIFLYSGGIPKDMGVKISYCQNCNDVCEEHFPLPKNAAHAETIEFLKHCHSCL